MLIVLAPILIDKDVFEPSYNDLKSTVQNHSYIGTNLIQGIEYSSLCSRVGPCQLPILHVGVSVHAKLLTYPSPPFPFGNRSLFSKSVSLFLFCKFVCVMFRFLMLVTLDCL